MKWLCEKYILWRGWTVIGERPAVAKAVIIGVPHTSNWDFLIFLGAISHFDMQVKYLIKDGVMKWPISWILTRLGAIPVDRTSRHSLIASVVASFDSHDEMMVLIAPEGTRARVDRWKSGFWRIADAADVPVVMSFIDAKAKQTGFGPVVKVAGNPEALMETARDFYADKHGLKPENVGPIQL